MKHKARFTSLSILLLTVLLMVGIAANGPAPYTAQAAETATGDIVLIARDIIVLKWDPSNYPRQDLQFVRWELWRGTSASNLTKISSGQSQVTDHHHDSGLTPGTTYHYRLDVIRCQAPCGLADQFVYTFFTDSATAGVFQGTVHYSLKLASGTYNIGTGDVSTGASVAVVDGATLEVGYGTTLQAAPGISRGGLSANGGRLEITGATLKNISIVLGNYYDETSTAGGWVNDCVMLEGSSNVTITLYGTSEATVDDNSGVFSITADQQASLKARNNTMTGGVEVNKQATAVIEDNEISNGNLTISGYGAAGNPKASAQIINNTINLDYKNMGIRVYNGATATVSDNTISYLGAVTAESSVVIDASDAGTILTAERNMINNGKIAAFWGPHITLADNVIIGDGSAVTIGCIFCGTGAQATGTIERNTIQNGWGLEMWAGSQELLIRHNCIRGNDPGLTVEASISAPLNVEQNWWGHASGPSHESNPGGMGDVIVGGQVDFDPVDTAGTYCRTTPPLPDKPDLRVEFVSMIQVVEGVTSLVEAKPLAVMADVSSDILFDQDVKFSLTYAGKTYSSAYIVEDDNMTKQFQLKSASNVLSFNEWKQHTILFFPDEAPFGSSATAQVEIDPANDVEESDEKNNVKLSTQPVVKTYWGADPGDQSLRILFNYSRNLSSERLDYLINLALRGELPLDMMPVAPIDYFAGLGLDKDLDYECRSPGPADVYAKKKHRALKTANPKFQLFVFLPRDTWWISNCESLLPQENELDYWLPENVPEIAFAQIKYPKLMIRSVMERLGAPTFTGEIRVDGGWFVSNKTFLDHTLISQHLRDRTVQSVLGDFSVFEPVWIDKTSYQMFLNRHEVVAVNNRQSTTAAGLILVSGTIADDGQAIFDPIFELPAGTPSSPSTGPYSLKFYDAGDQLLYRYDFDVDFTYDTEEGPQTKDMTAFSFALPRYAAATRVILEKDGSPLATLAKSAHAPTVQVTNPNGGENLSGQITVTWNAGDSDGDNLSYALLYSADNGAAWETLAMDLTTKSFLWDTVLDRGSDNGGLIKVMASDGYHTTSDTSDGTFSVANKAPDAGIVTPIDDAVVTQETDVVFEGAAYDMEEGLLEGTALSWSSTEDGALGSGNSITAALSPGQHVIQLLATDRGGLQDTAEITVTAGSETRPDLSLTAGDISHSPSLAVAKWAWLAVEVRNLVTDVTAMLSIYDGDPVKGGRLIGEVGFVADANSYQTVGIEWVPVKSGTYPIYAVISGADPVESSTGNNKAMIEVQVAEGKFRHFLPVIKRSAIGQ